MGIGLIVTVIAAGLCGLLFNGRRNLMWGGAIGLVVLIAEVLTYVTFMVVFGFLYADLVAGSGVDEILRAVAGEVWSDFSGVAVLILCGVPLLYFCTGIGAFWAGQRVKLRRAEVVQ